MTKQEKLSEYLQKRLVAHTAAGHTDTTPVFDAFLKKGHELAAATAAQNGQEAGQAIIDLFEDVASAERRKYHPLSAPSVDVQIPARHTGDSARTAGPDQSKTAFAVPPMRPYLIGASAGLLIALAGGYFFFNGTVTVSRSEVALSETVIDDVRVAVDRIEGVVGLGLPDEHPLKRRTGRWLQWEDAFPDIYEDMTLATKREGEGIFQLKDDGGWKAIFQSPVCSIATKKAPELVDPVRLGDTVELCNAIGLWNDAGASL